MITLGRIILVPVIVWAIASNQMEIAFAIFVIAGVQKVMDYAGTVDYMHSAKVPGLLLPAVIALEVAGGLALAIGFRARRAALALAGFSIIAAVLFHAHFADEMQTLLFMKDWSIAGGLLIVCTHGAARFSVDGARASSTAPLKSVG